MIKMVSGMQAYDLNSTIDLNKIILQILDPWMNTIKKKSEGACG